jgi:hypothetical protein
MESVMLNVFEKISQYRIRKGPIVPSGEPTKREIASEASVA